MTSRNPGRRAKKPAPTIVATDRTGRRITWSLPQAVQQAQALYGSGHRPHAEALCQSILTAQPDYFDALSLLGIIAAQTKRTQWAAELMARAIEARPKDAAAHCNYGNVLQDLKRGDEALASFDRAVELAPDLAGAHYNRGLALYRQGRLEDSLDSYARAIKIDPGYAEAHLDRGNALLALQRMSEALDSYESALRVKPRCGAAQNGCGLALCALNRRDEALERYRRALEIDPDVAEVHSNLGSLFFDLRRFDEALANCERALAINPNFPAAHFNRGNVLRRLKRPDEAVASYERALFCDPGFAEAYSARGVVQRDLNRWDEALADFDRAISLRPEFAEARHNRAMTHLLLGDFVSGWADYEWRWKNPNSSAFTSKRNFVQPAWSGGESLSGKTMLLHCEQGFGDSIQFCRYAALVAAAGARVILEAQEPLLRLFTSVEGVTQVVAAGNDLPPFDFHCPLMSMPLAFGTALDTIPTTPYLRSDPAEAARWRAKLKDAEAPRIGLAWSGNPGHRNDHNRSISLKDWVGSLPAQFQYVGLQKDVRDADRQTLEGRPNMVHCADQIRDFADVAALCQCVDLVISVDTSVAHLAAALGKETWILLPFVPDWRWLLGRRDSPWYPTARLYRQPAPDDWASVLTRVAADMIQRFQ